MTVVNDSDLKEIKEAIATISKQIHDNNSQIKEVKGVVAALSTQINEVEKNLTAKINEVEKNLTAKINEVEKNFTVKVEQLSGEIKLTNANVKSLEKQLTEQVAGEINLTNANVKNLDKQVEDSFSNLDKRITTQEFIYRAVFVAIISLFTTAGIKYLWNSSLF